MRAPARGTPINGPLAQSVEQQTFNLLVVRSIRTRPTTQGNNHAKTSTLPRTRMRIASSIHRSARQEGDRIRDRQQSEGKGGALMDTAAECMDARNKSGRSGDRHRRPDLLALIETCSEALDEKEMA
jgi:hypothetical protein